MQLIKKHYELIGGIFTILSFFLFILMFEKNRLLLIPLFLVVVILFIFGYRSPQKSKEIFNKIIKYRYPIAAIIFALCVIFQIHGSSLNYYNLVFPDISVDHDILFGNIRGVRGDEFNVQVPYYFSQYYNEYSLISDHMSLGGQDMIIGYNSPVLDITLLAKPFTWGYVLFGNSFGLSWYWSLKTILCIMVTFELFMIITKRNSIISLIGAFVLVFSPVMQWWFSPHLYDVCFWAITVLVVAYHYFFCNNKHKLFFTIIAPIAITGFVLALYPPIQVSLGFAILTLFIALLVRDKKQLFFSKIDTMRIIVSAIILFVFIGYFVFTSLNAISILNSTVYPGHRISTGGDSALSALFSNITSWFTPYKDSNISNNSEISTFNHLGVFFLLSFPYLFAKKTKESKNDLFIGTILFSIMLVQLEFMLIGIPEFLAKITLFSYISRMGVAFGFTATLASVWLVYYLQKYKQHNNKILFSISLVFILIYSYTITPENTDYMPFYAFIISLSCFLLVILGVIYKKKVISATVCLSVMFFSGMMVNPVVTGTAAIYEHSISTEIQKINQQNEGYWIATNSTLTQNFLLANGAKVLNSVNFYPDFEKWKIIDPKGEYEDIYNRYAHIETVLTKEKTHIELVQADYLRLYLNIDLLDELDVTYLLSHLDYTEIFEGSGVNYEKIYTDKTGYMIYKILPSIN